MFPIKIGVLISYDYEYFKHSLPCYYKHAHKIVLAIDKERKTWSGEKFEIEPAFFDWIEKIDTDKKITLYEDKFYDPGLSTAECDTRERNLLAKQLGEGGWHIQIDSDEYFTNFKEFVGFLRTKEPVAQKEAVQIFTPFITLFKKLEDGFLVIDGRTENIAMATNKPEYHYIRNVKDVKKINSPSLVTHQSWARSHNELQKKLGSWGHRDDFNTESYLKLWDTIDNFNYKYIRNFHPLTPTVWPALSLINTHNIPQLNSFLEEVHTKKLREKSSLKKQFAKLMPYFLVKAYFRKLV